MMTKLEIKVNWLKSVLTVAEKLIPLIPGIPPVLTPIIVEGIQIAERAQTADPSLTGAEKKEIASKAIFGHTDEPATHTVEVPEVLDAIDSIVAGANEAVMPAVVADRLTTSDSAPTQNAAKSESK